VGKKKVLKIYH